jgi:hypothetical protein
MLWTHTASSAVARTTRRNNCASKSLPNKIFFLTVDEKIPMTKET